MDQETLAELLGVSVDAVKSWRTKRMAKSSLSLQPDLPGKKATYSPANVARWLIRNPDYRDRVVALLAPTPSFVPDQPDIQATTPIGLAVIIPETYQLADINA